MHKDTGNFSTVSFNESEDIDGISYDYNKCCKDQQVKEECQYICNFNDNLNFLAFDQTCYSEIDEIMHCGSKNFNHRYCCEKNNVPEECLGWCLPNHLSSTNLKNCSSHIKTVAKCFSQGCNPEFIGDGHCDDHMATAECNFDGFDCCEESELVSNGQCDSHLFKSECNFDGGDCDCGSGGKLNFHVLLHLKLFYAPLIPNKCPIFRILSFNSSIL